LVPAKLLPENPPKPERPVEPGPKIPDAVPPLAQAEER